MTEKIDPPLHFLNLSFLSCKIAAVIPTLSPNTGGPNEINGTL